MRKLYLIISVFLTISLSCCKHKIEKCEDFFADMEHSELSKDSYNSVMNMIANTTFTYRSGFYDEYFNLYPNPVDHLLGDTFMVCGFITHPSNRPISLINNYWHCWILDDSASAIAPNCPVGGYSIYGDDISAIESINTSEKCYIKGFFSHYTPLSLYYSPDGDPYACTSSSLSLKVISIHN